MTDSQGGSARYALLQYFDPLDSTPLNLGVLLIDETDGSMRIRMRDDWDAYTDRDVIEATANVTEDLRTAALQIGSAAVEYLKATLSGRVRITERYWVAGADLDAELNRLFDLNVARGKGRTAGRSRATKAPVRKIDFRHD